MSLFKGKKDVFAIAHAQTHSLIPKKVPRLAWHILIMSWLAFAAQTFLRMCVFALEPVYAEEFELSAFACLMFPLIFTVMQAPLSPTLTHITDKLGGGFSGRHMTILVGAVCTLAASLISFKTFSGTATSFMLMIIICALFIGPAEPLICSMASDWFPMEYRGAALGFHHAGFPWGSLVAGFVISTLLTYFGSENWRLCFLFLSLPMVAVNWWIYKVVTLNNQRRLVSEINEAGYHSSIHDEYLPSEVGIEENRIGIGEAWRLTMKNPTHFIMFTNAFLTCGLYWVWAAFLPLFIYYVGGYSAAETAVYTVIFAVTGGLGQAIWGALSDKIGRKISLICIYIWAMVGFYLMTFSFNDFAWLIGAQLFVGFSTNAPYPIFYTVAYDIADRRVKGLAMGFIDFALYFGAVLIILAAFLIEMGGGKTSPAGYYWVLYMIIGFYAFATFLTLLFTRETKGWYFKKDHALVTRSSSNVPEL